MSPEAVEAWAKDWRHPELHWEYKVDWQFEADDYYCWLNFTVYSETSRSQDFTIPCWKIKSEDELWQRVNSCFESVVRR